jgi:hypothetical protein
MAVLERELPQATPQPHATADAIPTSLRRRGASPRQVLATSLIGAAILALFASRDLSSWAERLSGPLAEQMQNIATGWDQAMTTLGLTRPYDTLRSGMGHFLDCHWGNGQ